MIFHCRHLLLAAVVACVGCGGSNPAQDLPDATIWTGESVDVTFHPGASVTLGSPTTFAFGVPLPPGRNDTTSSLLITDAASQEVASHVVETTRFRKLGDPAVDSLRSATVWVTITFETSDPITYRVGFNGERTAELGDQGAVRDHWVNISEGVDPTEYTTTTILEPPVYATFPADFLTACQLRANATPVDENGPLGWFDTAMLGFSDAAVNDVGDHVTAENMIAYEEQFANWLFDRAMTLYGVYVRTGDITHLRRAHRATQFYAAHVNAGGFFDLKTSDDVKYSYGEAMLVDFILTGDDTLRAAIERTADAGESYAFAVEYEVSTNFWTERHLTYILLSALSAWELTGAQAHADRIKYIVDTTFAHALSPPGGFATDGCLPHTAQSHEGGPDPTPICSPWMSALLGDAIWRYYLASDDQRALTFLSGMGDYLVNYATYVADEGTISGLSLPYYLASSSLQFSDDGPYGDLEHTCDVMGLTARAAYAKNLLGQNNSATVALADSLQTACQFNLESWHRTGQGTIDAGKTLWRLSPPRKYSWWFGTTHDYGWLRANL